MALGRAAAPGPVQASWLVRALWPVPGAPDGAPLGRNDAQAAPSRPGFENRQASLPERGPGRRPALRHRSESSFSFFSPFHAYQRKKWTTLVCVHLLPGLQSWAAEERIARLRGRRMVSVGCLRPRRRAVYSAPAPDFNPGRVTYTSSNRTEGRSLTALRRDCSHWVRMLMRSGSLSVRRRQRFRSRSSVS